MSLVRTITDDAWIAVYRGKNYICTTADDDFSHAQLVYIFLVDLRNKTKPNQEPLQADDLDLLQYDGLGATRTRADLVEQISNLLLAGIKLSRGPGGLEYALIVNGAPYYVLREGPDYSL